MTNKVISESSYVHLEVLVDTEWLEAHLNDQKIRMSDWEFQDMIKKQIKL
jgi:3-mercaptopyruvate sulfurtransferase SseA